MGEVQALDADMETDLMTGTLHDAPETFEFEIGAVDPAGSAATGLAWRCPTPRCTTARLSHAFWVLIRELERRFAPIFLLFSLHGA